jgi:hypothetical protein
MRPPPIYPQSWPCHSIWKESFWRSDFSPQISSKLPKSSRDGALNSNSFITWVSSTLKRWSIKLPKKRERKIIEKKKQEKKEEKEKLQESLQIKGKSIFWGEKNTSTSKISFLMWFHVLPLHHTISKTLSKIIKNVFLALFGPSFNLAMYITWVVAFLFTHELHIFSL